MRIGIDGSSILPRRTGIGHYTNQLLCHLAQIDSTNEYVVLLNSLRQPLPHEPWMDRPNFSFRRHRIPGPALLYAWQFLNRPAIERLIGRVDVFHSPATYIPPQAHGVRVTTVHDLYFMRDPEVRDRLGGAYFMKNLPWRIQQMDRIIADSASTRDDLIELLAVPPEKITVVYAGVDSRFRPIEDPDAINLVRRQYGLPDRYILFVGTIEPRKNVERLIEAYAIVRSMQPDAPPLVLISARGKSWPAVIRAIVQHELDNFVTIVEQASHNDLPAIYCGSDLLVLPSLYEGFGLPVLEAMACGVPVVAGDTSSLRELAADGRGLLVDPLQPEKIAAATARMLADQPLRETSITRGLAFAREMSWEKTARGVLKVYEEIAKP